MSVKPQSPILCCHQAPPNPVPSRGQQPSQTCAECEEYRAAVASLIPEKPKPKTVRHAGLGFRAPNLGNPSTLNSPPRLRNPKPPTLNPQPETRATPATTAETPSPNPYLASASVMDTRCLKNRKLGYVDHLLGISDSGLPKGFLVL